MTQQLYTRAFLPNKNKFRHKKLYINVSSSFIKKIVKNWQQLRYPLMGEWLNTPRYHEMLLDSKKEEATNTCHN